MTVYTAEYGGEPRKIKGKSKSLRVSVKAWKLNGYKRKLRIQVLTLMFNEVSKAQGSRCLCRPRHTPVPDKRLGPRTEVEIDLLRGSRKMRQQTRLCSLTQQLHPSEIEGNMTCSKSCLPTQTFLKA